MEWEDVDELVREVTEMGHSQPKTLGSTPDDDDEWLPPELKLEIASERAEVKEVRDSIDQDVDSVPSQNLKKRRGKKENKISKSSKSTYPISCPRCALVRLTCIHQSKDCVYPADAIFSQPFFQT